MSWRGFFGRGRLGALLGMALIAALAALGAGCDADDISVCELPEALNTCEGDGDCTLVYCGVECCPCERAASLRQVEETYCMGEEHAIARNACEEARETICDGVDCAMSPCPRATRAVCEGGLCTAR